MRVSERDFGARGGVLTLILTSILTSTLMLTLTTTHRSFSDSDPLKCDGITYPVLRGSFGTFSTGDSQVATGRDQHERAYLPQGWRPH